ncbi:hypothetical protein M758_4G168800 [Ceratodon purpureus]|nr:hypothetical protein M758_4G168800 [Ceratodon purpureus]
MVLKCFLIWKCCSAVTIRQVLGRQDVLSKLCGFTITRIGIF